MRWLHAVLDVPPGLSAGERFWSAALGWPLGSPWPGHPELVSFEPPEGDPYVHRQVGDHRPRVHLDLEVADLDADAERLHGLGAAVGARTEVWRRMTSPGGLPFCLVAARPRAVPAPVDWGSHRSRLVQVCIDSPADRHGAEVAFWRAATNGRWVPGDSPEFAGKLYPDSGPLQILLQRLGADATATSVHLDLGTDDLPAEVDRLVGLGAERLGPGRGWVTLRDPAGMVFCVTGNPPVGGRVEAG